MAKAELYPDVEDIFAQLEDEDNSVESDYIDHQSYHADISISQRDRSHTAAVMDTDKSV